MSGEEWIEIGLNLKHAQKSLCIPDYTRPMNNGSKAILNADGSTRIQWEYSERAVKLLKDYHLAFPWIAAGLEKFGGQKMDFKSSHFFPEGTPIFEANTAVYHVRVLYLHKKICFLIFLRSIKACLPSAIQKSNNQMMGFVTFL
jgi:hypothetical protein